MLLDFGNSFWVDQRPEGRVGRHPVADLHFAHGSGKFFRKGVINSALNVNPVGADAGLAVVAELAHNRAFYGGVQIRIIKHDKRRVAAQFHGTFNHIIGRLAQQNTAHFG